MTFELKKMNDNFPVDGILLQNNHKCNGYRLSLVLVISAAAYHTTTTYRRNTASLYISLSGINLRRAIEDKRKGYHTDINNCNTPHTRVDTQLHQVQLYICKSVLVEEAAKRDYLKILYNTLVYISHVPAINKAVSSYTIIIINIYYTFITQHLIINNNCSFCHKEPINDIIIY